jgi:hypothetical protein
MRYLKTLGLAVVALLVFGVGSAAAIVVTEEPGNPIDVGDVVKATSTHLEFTGTVPYTCTLSEMEGTVTQAGGTHGGTTANIVSTVDKWTWGGCTSTFITIKGGTLTLAAGGTAGTGTLTMNGSEFTILTHSIFIGTRHCIYVTNNTHIGTVSESGRLTISSAGIPEKETDTQLCKDDAALHGNFTFTVPAGFTID